MSCRKKVSLLSWIKSLRRGWHVLGLLVRETLKVLNRGATSLFLFKGIWLPRFPTKAAFLAWEATWAKVLILDKLERWGWHLPNRCYMCGCAEESVHHIWLHCLVVSSLWEIIFSLIGVSWVFPKMVKEVILSWRGKKRKKIWKSVPHCIFWIVWKEKNRIALGMGL